MAKFFNKSEFACKCGCGQNLVKDALVFRLDEARENAGIPFIITSGYRCKKHNEAVGGVADSEHTLGEAVDIAATDSSSRFKIVASLLSSGFSRIGVSDKFVHAGISTKKGQDVFWLYPSSKDGAVVEEKEKPVEQKQSKPKKLKE